jgi:DNA-binding response OmpR family regulator
MSWDDIPTKLRSKYLRAGSMQVARLMRLLGRLQVDPADLGALRALLHCFHSLAGWSAVEGLPLVGVAGQLGEHDCSALLSASTVPERRHLDQIKTLIYLLRREIRQQRSALALAGTAAAARAAAIADELIAAPPLASPVDLAALPVHDAVPAFAAHLALPALSPLSPLAALPEEPTLPAPLAFAAPAVRPALRAALRAASPPAPAAGEGARQEPRRAADTKPLRRALLVGMHEEEAELLRRSLKPHGIALDAVETSFEAGSILGGGLPDAVIATADLADGTGYVLADYLRGLPGGQQTVVVILGAAGHGSDPGELVRCGIDAFFAGPADGAALAACVAQQLERQEQDAPRVVCLEDDAAAALALRELLHEGGYRVRLCNDPRRLLRLTLSFDADLLLMDVPQPDGTASDLVRRLRQDPRSAIVPIVLLTDAGRPRSTAPSLIGAEYLAKPVAAADLLTSVAHRIDRSRALRRLFAESPAC